MKLFTHNIAQGIQSPPTKKQCKFSSSKAVRSHVSPLTKSSKKSKYSDLLSSSSSSSSLGTFGQISLFENSSEARTVGSPVIKVSKFQPSDSIDYEAELDLCRRQNLDLQSKIEKLQQRTSNRARAKNSEAATKETDRNRASRESIENRDRRVNSEDKETCFVDRSEIEREFEIAHDQAIRKIKKKHSEQMAELENSLREKFRQELEENEREHEMKINKKIAEITSEFERKFERAQDEVNWLRKQNEKMKRGLEEANSKMEVIRLNPKHEEISNRTYEGDRRFADLQKQFMALQHDYLRLKKEGGLCSKCKAFTETNEELLSKINRIRSYIESSVN